MIYSLDWKKDDVPSTVQLYVLSNVRLIIIDGGKPIYKCVSVREWKNIQK